MSKINNFILLFILFDLFLFVSCTDDIKEIDLNEEKKGSLKNDEYDYYKITLPGEINKNGQLIFELEPNKILDDINNIVSDPSIYISIEETFPTKLKSTWSSNRYGDETVSISGQYIRPFQYFHIGVYCKEKCNYILKISLANNIIIEENQINSFTLESRTVMKFSFITRKEFKELSVNIAGQALFLFDAYLAEKNPSSSNTLPSEPILFNGQRFIIKNDDSNKNSEVQYHLIIDNNYEKRNINIWLKYDDDIIKMKESELAFSAISENKADCYSYLINKVDKNKDLILSTTLFNGLGFIYINGFTPVNPSIIDQSYKYKENSYPIIQNRAIHLTEENFKRYGKADYDEDINLNFCFYAEKNASLFVELHLLENVKKIQTQNYIFPGIKIEDVLPKKSLTRYTMKHFNINNDLNIFLTKKTGKTKLYLYMMPPDRENDLLDYDNFQMIKSNNLILEAEEYFEGYYLFLSKESNKCKVNKSGKFLCSLNAIVECAPTEDCTYDLFFDHSKVHTYMEPKQIYTNVISDSEEDIYFITIRNPSIKNIAVVLTPITGRIIFNLTSFKKENGEEYYLKSNYKNNDFMPTFIKISLKNYDIYELPNLNGIYEIKVKGLTYGSYSLYYYTYNEEEEEYLDQDKVSMKLEKGQIIKDVFMDDHKFKVYMFDCSKNGEKDNLYITLVETNEENSELYIFKDLNDFSIKNDNIYGYLWKGGFQDYVYIDKDDKNYINTDILYIMIYKKSSKKSNTDGYTTFYLGLTDDKTPLLLTEAIEFTHHFDKKHKNQTFYYYYIDNNDDLKISFSLISGRINVGIKINNIFCDAANIVEDSFLFTFSKDRLAKICQKTKCPIEIEVSNDDNYLSFSTFLIAVRNAKDIPMILKQGTVSRKSILNGEVQHFIIDLVPDVTFGAKISVYFSKGQGEIYARKALKSELFNITNFPDENNYEYMSTYKTSQRNFYLIEIPYSEIIHYELCKVLLTVKGILPGFFSTTTIEYSISVSNTVNQLNTDKNYKLFISQGEIQHYHFKLKDNKKRLYISMTNKEQDAFMYLNFEAYSTSISDYRWRNIGGYNEFIDISVDDPFFVSRQMKDIDGDYYLAIQGISDCFFNLYISAEDVKIITLDKNSPAGCSCQSKNDYCYFRYENINDPSIRQVFEQELIFYTEYTYGSGTIFGKIYPNGNMEEIMTSLPTITNNDYIGDESDKFLYVNLNTNNPKYTFSSVLVVGVQCKENSLFDLTAALLDQKADLSRNDKNYIMLKLNQDNFYYISHASSKSYKFVYYINVEEILNFNVKAITGQAQVHAYTNETLSDTKFKDYEDKSSSGKKFHHISNFIIDAKNDDNYYGIVPSTFGKRFYLFIDVKTLEDCLVNININYNTNVAFLPINKEIVGIINNDEYFAYFDMAKDIEDYIITVTTTDKKKTYSVYVKINLIKAGQSSQINDDQTKYSKPGWKNYDIKGKTNSLTSSLSLRIKNVAKDVRKDSIVRVLVNIDPDKISYNDKVKIIVTPVINKINRIRPKQHIYYFTEILKEKSDKTLFMLNNLSADNNLMIIEISICKGEFLYVLLDSPPGETETYTQLKKREITTFPYTSNGKKIITVKDIEVKDYYLVVYGASNPRNLDLLTREDIEIGKTRIEISSEVDLLFCYYTTNSKKYNYLVTQDFLQYESNYDFYSIKFKLPELKRRDLFGKEKYVDYINYTLIVSEEKVDYYYMESTCYLTKIMESQQKENPYNYIKTDYDKTKNIFKAEGFLGDKTYYMNLMAKNEYTGEIITYRPIMIKTSELNRKGRNFVIVFLSIIFTVFICITFTTYRQYRIQQSKISSFQIDKNSDSSKNKSLKNINLSFTKKKYDTLNEDTKELNG